MIDALIKDMAFELLEKEYVKRAKKRDGAYEKCLEALAKRILELCGQENREQRGSVHDIPRAIASVSSGAPKHRGRAKGSKNKPRSVFSVDDTQPKIVQQKQYLVDCLKNEKGNECKKAFPEDYPVNDIEGLGWLKDLGLPWSIVQISPPNDSLGSQIGRVQAVASKQEGGERAEIEAMGGSHWTVHFRRA